MKVSVFWFRRDLRLEDNTGLIEAAKSGTPVLPIFIFDPNILDELPVDDKRVSFIYDRLLLINSKLNKQGSSLLVKIGDPKSIFRNLIKDYSVENLFYNKDYEPYSLERDRSIDALMISNGVEVKKFKDQVLFEESEVVKPDGSPYTVFTPYQKTWLKKYTTESSFTDELTKEKFIQIRFRFPDLHEIGFEYQSNAVREYDISRLDNYENLRNIPGADATSYLSVHLRFGTVSIRQIVSRLFHQNPTFVSELIWREFFMQILYHFPDTINNNFKRKYDNINWRNNEEEFELWKKGRTGYPIVDAGMSELNKTGYMHNRVRMIVASFLVKHLLIDWRWGEAFFASKLLDYELSSNNGNWQWSAGTGCDAAPYFRVFNPWEQQRKFDPEFTYIKKWILDFDPENYLEPIVDHRFARERAINVYSEVLKRGV